jgi:predicted AAA+ superfamily ATPase
VSFDPDIDVNQFARAFQKFLQQMEKASEMGGDRLTPLGHTVTEFLGVDLNSVDPVAEEFVAHQVVDVDYAARRLVEENGGEVVGVTGSHRIHVDSFLEFLMQSHFASFEAGPVSYTRVATGPKSDRRVISFGLSMLRMDDVPLAVLHRGANRHYGRENYTLEVLCPDVATVDRYLSRLRELMAAHSVLRGQVISFQPNNFDMHDAGNPLQFLQRPTVSAEQVILPAGVRERVSRHVVGIGERREALQAAGQHLKRGVLLYGPPGTGKTHLVRHLLASTPGTTAVLLTGRTLALLNDAAKLARANQPAIVVLEDCDLVAEERGGDTNAALFETLEALDGLDGDADITFILTTNRPDLLERALVERPGRVDLAVEIAKPDLEARFQLLQLYAAALGFSPAALRTAAERTDGATASFAAELIRRSVLNAAQSDRQPGDADLLEALDEMTSEAEAFTRMLLGGGEPTLVDETLLVEERVLFEETGLVDQDDDAF